MKSPTSAGRGIVQETSPLPGSKLRSTTGLWIPSLDLASCNSPQYIFASDSPHNNPFSTNHFFISVVLNISGRNIRTYAFLDSGATGSHISESFVTRHSISRRTLPTAVPVTAVDGRPLASGFMTQEVYTHLNISDHTERIHLGIVACPYPIILGLDWLQQHNPNIDWKTGKMKLKCCNIKYHTVVSSFGSSYDLDSNPIPPNSTVSAVGLGLRLNDSRSTPSPWMAPIFSKSAHSHTKPGIRLATETPPSTIDPEPDIDDISPPPSRKPGHSQTKPLLHSFCNLSRFKKYAKHQPVGVLNYYPDKSSISSIDPSSGDLPCKTDIPEKTDFELFVPAKYSDFEDVFTFKEDSSALPPFRPGIDLKIETTAGKEPPWGPMYSMSAEERASVVEYVEDKLAKGHIRRSKSPAGAPVLFTKRKTGALRFCVDYRGLNAITKRNSFPLPLPDDLLDRTAGCKIFSVIDLKNAFNLVRIAEGDEWKTAFRTHMGLFEMTVMPFGLTNAPANFQFFIQRVLSDLIDIKCVVYLDDILVYSKTQEDHDQAVKDVLTRLRGSELFANPKKCEFDKDTVEYLGYLVSESGVTMNPKKLSTVTDWPIPTSVVECQQFIGFCNFNRRFIHNYSKLVMPLQALTHKTDSKSFPTPLPDDALASFLDLKKAFTSAPTLRHFDPSRASYLITDASDFAMAGIHLQPDDENELHPCAYYSRKWTPAEINYDTHDKELLAIVDSFRDMRSWLIGTAIPVTVISDHRNLQYFMQSRALNRRQSRWAMFLSDFYFKLDWMPGSKNPADFPSRRPDYALGREDSTTSNPILSDDHLERLYPHYVKPTLPPPTESIEISSAVVASIQTYSIDNSELLARFRSAYLDDTEWREGLESQKLPGHPKEWRVDQNLVFHQDRLFVPKPLRVEIIHSRHDAVISGHPGRARTYDLLARDFSWPGMRRFVRSYCSSCDNCQRNKAPRHKPYGLLQPLSIPDRPWRSIAMDFIVKLPRSRGFDSIWVVCDRLTRGAHFIPIEESTNSSELARFYLSNVFKLHGFPESIVSDRGPTFVSSFFSSLMKLVGSKMTPSTAYHPKTDGLTERTNQTLESYLRAYCSYQQDDWVDYLPLAEFAFNNAINSSTQVSPFYANLGYHPNFDFALSEPSSNPAASELAERLNIIHEELKAELAHANDAMSKYYNAKHLPAPQFAVGDRVLLLRRNIKTTRPSDKLDYRKLGPYEILERRGNSGYLLKLPAALSRLHPVFDITLLEPYHDPTSIEGRLPSSVPTVRIESQDSPREIETILECRKLGRRFDYFVKWFNTDTAENSWIHLSDIPRSKDELLETFHRRNPRSVHPPRFSIVQERSKPPSEALQPQAHTAANPSRNSHNPTQAVPNSSFSSNSTGRWMTPSTYVPPSRTTLRSGRVSRPRDMEGG